MNLVLDDSIEFTKQVRRLLIQLLDLFRIIKCAQLCYWPKSLPRKRRTRLGWWWSEGTVWWCWRPGTAFRRFWASLPFWARLGSSTTPYYYIRVSIVGPWSNSSTTLCCTAQISESQMYLYFVLNKSRFWRSCFISTFVLSDPCLCDTFWSWWYQNSFHRLTVRHSFIGSDWLCECIVNS